MTNAPTDQLTQTDKAEHAEAPQTNALTSRHCQIDTPIDRPSLPWHKLMLWRSDTLMLLQIDAPTLLRTNAPDRRSNADSHRPTLQCSYCYVFLTYPCAHNGLPLGPSSLLRHTSLSRTDYDSYTSFCWLDTSTPTSSIWLVTRTDSLLVRLLVVSVAFQVPVLVVSAWRLVVFNLYH
jgi:hypothetical protein